MYTPFCLRRFSDFFEDIWAAYTDQDTQEQGVSTGWKGLDPFYRVRTAFSQSDVWQGCLRAECRSFRGALCSRWSQGSSALSLACQTLASLSG